jgi:NADPH:quinone reductase-like Zn-dependent oxidoreductase
MSTEKINWVANGRGNSENLTKTNVPLGSLESGKIRIKTKAIGLNFADIFAILGLYSAAPKPPFTPGLEYSGIVEEINTDTDFKIGDKIIGICKFNGYSSYIDIEPSYCIHLPKSWSFEEGAGYIVQTLTAWYAMKHLGDIRPNQNVIVNSAAGGVGLQAMKLCNAIGANPFGTVSSEKKKQFLKTLGFENVIVRSTNFKEQVVDLLNAKPIHLILDAIGGKIQKSLFNLLNPMGRLVIFGAANFTPRNKRLNPIKAIIKYLKRPKYDPLKMVELNKSVLGFNLIWLWEHINLLQEMLKEVEKLKLSPPYIGKVFSFGEGIEAIDYLKSGHSIGKVVLKLTD